MTDATPEDDGDESAARFRAARSTIGTLPRDPETPMRRYSLADAVDAVVIGTGAGGGPILARLARAGLKVVALEAGSFLNPAEYASDERAQSYLYWLDERITDGGNPVAFGKNNSGIGVGGSTLHWGAYVPRPHAAHFRLHAEFGVARDWPFQYQDLVPYYEEVERFIGVSGPAVYPWDAGRKYPLPPLPLNAPAQLMQRGCEALGLRTAAAPLAAVSTAYSGPGYGSGQDYPERAACVNRGYCHQGCRNGAKASMDVTFLPAAVRAGAEIRAEAFVTDLELDEQGEITGVVYKQDGEERRQQTKAVFLCAGTVESARLLLRLGLANSSGQVGRNFMAHPSTQIWGTFPEDTRPYKGFPASLITEDPMVVKDADFASGYLIQSYGIMPLAWAESVARGRGLWGAELVRYLQSFPNVAGMGISGDCLPHKHNFVELSDELDSRGLPKPLVHFTAGENENRLMEHSRRLMHQIWDAAAGEDCWTFDRFAHQIGTCRMGDDPGDSVVDACGRSHDVPNLYISDNSVFPTAQPSNPALTIMALSLRCADRFLGRP